MPADMKTIIADTFAQMIRKGDIDKITVKNVIEECHISRQTFYYHFHDLMEVLEWSFERAAKKLFQESMEADGRQAALERFVAFAYEHHREIHRLLNSRTSHSSPVFFFFPATRSVYDAVLTWIFRVLILLSPLSGFQPPSSFEFREPRF